MNAVLGPPQVTRVSVVAEYSDGTVRRMSCDHPAAAQFDVTYQPPCFYPVAYPPFGVPSAYSSPPEFRMEVVPGYSPVVMEVVEGAAIARARALQYVIGYTEEIPEAAAHARKRAREQLAIATLEAGCVMLALPGETTTRGRFGETTLDLAVAVAPAA